MGKQSIKNPFIISLAIIFIIPLMVMGNSPVYDLKWKSVKLVSTPEGNILKVPELREAVYDPSFDYYPLYSVLLEGKQVTSVSVVIVDKEPMFSDDYDPVSENILDDSPRSVIKVLHQRGQVYSRIWVFPFYKDPETGRVHRILSFSLTLNEKNQNQPSVDYNPAAKKSESVESVLSEGDWYKIGVTENGVYRITYDYLEAIGIDPTSIEPGRIKIYGNGGGMLPQANNKSRPTDLIENHIWINGDEDGRFDSQDYILFYGQSPHKLDFSNAEGEYVVDYEHHDYSDTTFYFLTTSGPPGMRIQTVDDLGSQYPPVETFDDLIYHEADRYNILGQGGSGSGREWFGEVLQNNVPLDFDFNVSTLVPDTDIRVISSVLGQSVSPAYFNIELNGIFLGAQEPGIISGTTYSLKGRNDISEFLMNSSTLGTEVENLRLSYEFNGAQDGISNGFLDYFNIWCKRELIFQGNSLLFRSIESTLNPVSTFTIQSTSTSINIWNITDPLRPVIQEYSEGGDIIRFGTRTDSLKTFILFDNEMTREPNFSGRVENQNLHGMNTPELLIITHRNFMVEAERLALHRNQRGIIAEVVDVAKIFNEFSSGSLDVVAIRDFIKYLYDQDNRLKSVLMFGRGTYDFKNKLGLFSNLVPIYESRNSLHPIYSYASDDFFGFLDDEEGEWEESLLGEHMLDIGIGRLPVKNQREASTVVDKIIVYETDPRSFGPWRNDIYFVADDGDGADGIKHSRDADRLSVLVDTAYSNFNIGKIYVDAYPQNILPNRQEVPQANDAINNAVKNGALIINFTGHGNETQWTSENILNIVSINRWENPFKLPLLVTATCEFGRHDDPTIRSGAEFALISERGGAIGLVTTSRPVFSITNFILNQSFYENVFKKVDGLYSNIGEIFRRTKNESSGSGPVNRNFSLLADPSLTLAYPNKNIIIDNLNENESDTLQALKKVKLSGKIFDIDNKHLSTYQGILTASVYDKPELKQTLGTQDPIMVYEERNSLIFKGDVTIKNGSFTLEFIVPKNISYRTGEGKISLYSIDDAGITDAAGANDEIIVGGSTHDFIMDNTPPEILLYMEDTTFQNGDVTSDHPVLLASIFDESGINIIEREISKGLILELDNGTEQVVNQFYKADVDDYRNGTLRYQFSALEEALHTATLRVWDTYNNMSEASIEFVVGETNHILIKNLINYPNPFREETRFSFEHNRSGESLSITIEIYSTRGELLKTIEGVTKNSDFRINDITWDGRGESGAKLPPGVYIYKLFVRSLLDGVKNEVFKKLVIIK